MKAEPLTVFLVRHGRTAWNREGRFQGWSDAPLDDEGLEQAKFLGRRLAGRPLDAVYSSDLIRAAATARIIAGRRGCPLRADPRLRELSFGDWEGKTFAEIAESHPDQFRAWRRDPTANAPPGGETLAQLAARTGSVWGDLRALQSPRHVAVVAHGGSLQMLICIALDLPPERYRQFPLRPGSLSELAVHPEGAVLNRLNEAADGC
ncbi:MAG: alpha-ribazole phosphatase [Anaerolineales bacterium]|nr:alpha-ribazole phosphatase [Anaerolineales bacterium]